MENTVCPICGTPLSTNSYVLRDQEICRECADELRFAYPLIHMTKEGLKKPDLAAMPMFRDLAPRDQRFLLKQIEEDSDYGTNPDATFTIDRLHLVTLKEFMELLPRADALEDQIRADYFDYTNVCMVVKARPLSRPVGPIGIQNRHRRRRGFCIAGYIKTGRFSEGDLVAILHNGRMQYAGILAMGMETASVHPDGTDDRCAWGEELGDRGDNGVTIRAGYQVLMILDETAAGVAPGDLIVTD